MSVEPKRRYTLEEYLELERTSEERWEFWEGEVYATSGGTLPHDVISDNVFGLLNDQLRDRPCRVFSSNRLIKVPAAPPYRYADGSVVCGKVETEKYGGVDLLLNPILLWETLSPSTRLSIAATNSRGTNPFPACANICLSRSTGPTPRIFSNKPPANGIMRRSMTLTLISTCR